MLLAVSSLYVLSAAVNSHNTIILSFLDCARHESYITREDSNMSVYCSPVTSRDINSQHWGSPNGVCVCHEPTLVYLMLDVFSDLLF